MKELGKTLGYSTLSSLYGQLDRLHENGTISWGEGQIKTVQVLQPDLVKEEYKTHMKKHEEIYSNY